MVLSGGWYLAVRAPISNFMNDCKSLETYLNEYISSEADRAYLDQEIRACKGEDLDKSKRPFTGETPTPSATPSATPTETLTTTPSATPTETANPNPPTRIWEFLANRPAGEKNAINSYGPIQGLKIDKRLDDPSVTVDEALTELRYRMEIDPMATAAMGPVLGMWGYEDVNAKTKAFMNDFAVWDEARAGINHRIDGALANGKIKMVKLNGTYTASYSIPGTVPDVRTDANVPRNGQLALSVDGHLLQLVCSFQEYWLQQGKKDAAPKGTKAMPAPSKGMTRTPEGTPIKEKPSKTPTVPPTVPPTTPPTVPPTVPPTTPPTVPPTTPPTVPTTVPPTTKPPTKPTPSPKSSSPSDYEHKTEAPKAKVTEPARPKPDPVQTAKPGGGGVVDTPTKTPGSESGVTAPGANPAPTQSKAPKPQATGANTPAPSASSCVPAPGKASC